MGYFVKQKNTAVITFRQLLDTFKQLYIQTSGHTVY